MRRASLLTAALLMIIFALPGCGLLPAAPVAPEAHEAQPPAEIQPTATLPVTPLAELAEFAAATPTPEVTLPAPPTGYDIGSVWAINQQEQLLVKFDPDTNTLLAQVGLSGMLGPITGGEGSVWVAQNMGDQTILLRINPRSLAIEANIPIEQGRVNAMVVGLGSVWLGIEEEVGEREPGDITLPGGLLRVDPTSNSVADYFRREAHPTDLVIYDNAVWALSQLDVVSIFERYDPAAAEWQTLPEPPQDPTSADPASVYRFTKFALTEGGIWCISMDGTSHLLYRLDPSTAKLVHTFNMGDGEGDLPADLEAQPGSLWVSLMNGKVQRIDPLSGAVLSSFEHAAGYSRLFIAAGQLWVDNPTGAELYRLNPETLQSAALFVTGRKPMPTPTYAPRKLEKEECVAAYQTRLEVGMRAVVASDPPVPNRLRAEPGTETQIVGEIPPGQGMQILEGPICLNNWIWWKVHSDAGKDGWTSEGDEEGYWLIPAE